MFRYPRARQDAFHPGCVHPEYGALSHLSRFMTFYASRKKMCGGIETIAEKNCTYQEKICEKIIPKKIALMETCFYFTFLNRFLKILNVFFWAFHFKEIRALINKITRFSSRWNPQNSTHIIPAMGSKCLELCFAASSFILNSTLLRSDAQIKVTIIQFFFLFAKSSQ